MVKAVADAREVTPAAAASVMFCATITPEMGAYTFTIGLGWALSTPKIFNCSSAAVRSALASFSVSSACSTMDCEMAPCWYRSLARTYALLASCSSADGLRIGVESIADVWALHAEEQLAFLDVVVEPRTDIDDAAIGHGDHRNLARDVGKDRARHIQLVGLIDAACGHKRDTARDSPPSPGPHCRLRIDLRLRDLAFGGVELLSAAGQRQACRKQATGLRRGFLSSLDHLASHGKIELRGGYQIGADSWA